MASFSAYVQTQLIRDFQAFRLLRSVDGHGVSTYTFYGSIWLGVPISGKGAGVAGYVRAPSTSLHALAVGGSGGLCLEISALYCIRGLSSVAYELCEMSRFHKVISRPKKPPEDWGGVDVSMCNKHVGFDAILNNASS